MSGAVIGLLGALAGALIAGISVSYADRRTRRVDAVATGRMIVSELETAAEFLDRPAGAELSVDVLPRAPWNESAPKLAFDITQETLNRVHDAYTVIGHVADPSGDGATSSRVRDAAENLSHEIEWVATRRQRNRAIIRVALAAAFIAASVASLVIDVQDRSPDAVTKAVQAQLGDVYIVDCDPKGEDWACAVALAEGGCPLSSSSSGPEDSATPTEEPEPSAASPGSSRKSRKGAVYAAPAVAIVPPDPTAQAAQCRPGTESTVMQCSDGPVGDRLTLVGAVPEVPNALLVRSFYSPKQSVFARLVAAVGGSD